MKCPTDGAVLVMSERSGIEIDYCPECRGIWLDRGELDKIIDHAVRRDGGGSGEAPPPAAHDSVASTYEREQAQRREMYSGYERPGTERPEVRGSEYPSRGYDQQYDQRYDRRRGSKKRRKHWLEELFD